MSAPPRLLRHLVIVIVIVSLVFTVSPAPAASAAPRSSPPRPSPLGLINRELVAEWRKRAVRGPYKVEGDAGRNNPGDWTRIRTMARRYFANPHAYHYRGMTFGYPGPIVMNNWPSKSLADAPGQKGRRGSGEPIRDAAFWTMVKRPPRSKARLRTIRDGLLSIARSRYNDFSNRLRFNLHKQGTGFDPAFDLARWMGQLVFAYDASVYADAERGLGVWSRAQKRRFTRWVASAGPWFKSIVDRRLSGMLERGRATAMARKPNGQVLWSGGPRAPKIATRLDNHVPRILSAIVYGAVLTGNDARLRYAKRYVRRWLDWVAVFSHGSPNTYRWTDREPGRGVKYGMEDTAGNVHIALLLARNGDRSLFNYVTRKGLRSVDGKRLPMGPKTLRKAARWSLRFVDETSRPRRYAMTRGTNLRRRFDMRDEVAGAHRMNDLEFVAPNGLLWRNRYIRRVTTRRLPGTPAFPERPHYGQYWYENGFAGFFPGVSFMYQGIRR